MKTHSDPPLVQVVYIPESGSYSLEGFRDFDQWMNRNDPLYKAAASQAATAGMNELDRSHLMVAVLARALYETRNAFGKHVHQTGAPGSSNN